MMPAIAIVGMACRYPDADSPIELWENVLAQRRAFRRIPAERLRLEDYYSDNREASDYIYITQAALLKDYEFDRIKFRVAGTTFRSADLTHWLALDVAAQALADAGFPEGVDLNREATGVILGNSLTGEFSRANQMRLRWPYVRRVVEAALAGQDWSGEQRRDFLLNLEAQYKAPFPPIDEETLAGGLSNTIAGRICNYFDLKGGGYTVDGACASSLLAITTACSALTAGDLDVALAGGVDLSLDPFELVGFARTSALASEKMRVYDKRSDGFWPGEGCGFVVLMRHEDAVAQQRRIYGLIRGWGVSSDGSGGITRPEVEGQLLAIRRAYQRAGFGIETVSYFEGHGTGTAVGDATELRALAYARREAAHDVQPAVIGSIKANIGHTKAAAGMAGLIKTTLAVYTQIIPPTSGSEEPHPELMSDVPVLKTISEGQCWPEDRPLRAGVSAMGFGGINTHLVLEGVTNGRCNDMPDMRDRILLRSPQDVELFLLSGQNIADLRQQVEHLLTFANKLSVSELIDLAAEMQRTLTRKQVRAAIVAATPAELTQRLEKLRIWLADGETDRLDLLAGMFLGNSAKSPRIGFLFPGQGSPTYLDGGAIARRFSFVSELYAQANFSKNGYDNIATVVAQPAIVTASMAGLRIMNRLGIRASVAVGHSLGELSALQWAGVMNEAALLRIAAVRGRAMMALGDPTGAMATIRAGRDMVEGLLNGEAVSIACLNTPRQTVISGMSTDVATIVARAQQQGLEARNIPVSHAFHSPLVAAAGQPLADHLASEELRPCQQTVISTITGQRIGPEVDIRDLLYRQVTEPVRFTEAISQAIESVDLLIEVGPGRVLSGLAGEFVDIPVIALDAGSSSLAGLLQAAGAAFALGAQINDGFLFADRFSRPFDLNWQSNFLANPCELAPIPEDETLIPALSPHMRSSIDVIPGGTPAQEAVDHDAPKDALTLVRRLVAERLELPLAAVSDNARLLSDLHLNSITVSQIVAEAARQLDLPGPVSPTDFANVTIVDVAQTLEEIGHNDSGRSKQEGLPAGVDAWIRGFKVDWMPASLPEQQVANDPGSWRVISAPDYSLAESIQELFAETSGGGVVVCLPPNPNEDHIDLLLEGAQMVLTAEVESRFVLVQHGGGGSAFARTFHMEAPDITICVIDIPIYHPQAVAWAASEAATAATGYTEARYNDDGQRQVPVLHLLPLDKPGELPLGPEDVLIVSGGGKGIMAECALSLALETGVRLALMGRSQPETDTELALNLKRMAEAGVEFWYLAADVTDQDAVRAAIQEVETTFGPVTAILHGAARNAPRLLRDLDIETFQRTLAPKIQGARNLLRAIKPEQLRLFVSFGSIIARIGLPGEADYGLANEWLARLTEQIQNEHPACRCLTIDWSVWAGAGMGERLGTLDNLMRQGIMPIPLDEGVRTLHHLLGQMSALPASVIVSGRFGSPETLSIEQPELPFWRFLEQVQVYYPGVELVVDATLSGETDPYLADHVFQGERLFLAVLGLEAMAQVAMVLAGTDKLPIFEDVALRRPIVVPEGAKTTIRLAALRRESGQIEIALRSQETAFQVDHFRATCRFDDQLPEDDPDVPLSPFPPLILEPDQELYEKHFFHKGRLRRVRGYRLLTARHMAAELSPEDEAPWFGRYLPSDLVLGDPGARDATIHSIQVCVPQTTLLPISVERIRPSIVRSTGPHYVQAHERVDEAEGDTVIFDLVVTNADGCIIEEWQGLRLKMMGGTEFIGAWSPPVLGPYLERRFRSLVPGSDVTVVVERNAETDRRERSNLAIQRAIGEKISITRRADGKPEGVGGFVVSAAHALDLTLAVTGPKENGVVSCDMESVTARSEAVWQDLLGSERFKLVEVLARAANHDQDHAATRVWSASECLKKAGAAMDIPITLEAIVDDGWVLFSSGPYVTATYVARVQTRPEPLVLAVLVRRVDATLL